MNKKQQRRAEALAKVTLGAISKTDAENLLRLGRRQIDRLPGDTSAETLAAITMDELAIGVINKKTTSVRLIPAPGKKAGDKAVFGGPFGESPIMAVQKDASDAFVRMGGRIPAPLTSLNN